LDAAANYVPVRVLDMIGVDLNVYRFDYDLTFAVLLMNGDGTIYHRYGSRNSANASDRLSMTSLVRLLRETLADHAAYTAQPAPKPAMPRRVVEEIPPLARKIARRTREGKKQECIHCHTVNDTERDFEREQKRWSREATIGMWPRPEKIGLTLDRDEPRRVLAVAPDSAAFRAGIREGDRIERAGEEQVRSEADLQWALEKAPSGPAEVAIEYRRGEGPPVRAVIQLKEGWKLASELEFSWRASMWELRPRPGFGGREVAPEKRAGLGLAAAGMALEVTYIVDWGDDAATGENIKKAGLRKGDVVLSVAGKSDFASELHFQTWFRYTRKPGERVEFEVLRDGARRKLEITVLQ